MSQRKQDREPALKEKLKVGRTIVELSNTAKALFPDDGITKGDLVAYYQSVAETMLPLLRDRPVSMTRFPDGITENGIVQKNVPAYFPGWITRVRVRELGLPAFVKTTGGKGLHVHVPLGARKDFGPVRAFAREVAELLAARNPGLVTTEQRKDKRGPRIYADIMRNAYAQLAVAPYSVRARPGVPVATPLSWDELDDKGLHPGQFTLRTVPDRIREAGWKGGPWMGMARRRPGSPGRTSPCDGSRHDRRPRPLSRGRHQEGHFG